MYKPVLKHFFVFFDTFTLLFLCGLSTILTWDVLMKYQSKDSSFKHSRVSITELPTIVLCPFHIQNNLTYGVDFNISMYNAFSDFLNDKDAMTHILNAGYNKQEKVTFSILQTGFEGECFKIKPTESVIGKGVFHVVTLNENSSVFDEKIKIYIP